MFRDYACVVLDDCTGEPIGHGLPRSHHDASLLVIHTVGDPHPVRLGGTLGCLHQGSRTAADRRSAGITVTAEPSVSIKRRLNVSALITLERSMIPCRSASRCSTTGASKTYRRL